MLRKRFDDDGVRDDGGGDLPPLLLGRHGGVELGEALAQARLRRHRLGHAPADAARLAARQRLGREVVHARVEAVVDEVAEDLEGGGVVC